MLPILHGNRKGESSKAVLLKPQEISLFCHITFKQVTQRLNIQLQLCSLYKICLWAVETPLRESTSYHLLMSSVKVTYGFNGSYSPES